MSAIDKARELGEALSETPEYLALCAAKAEIENSEELRGLVIRYIGKERALSELNDKDDLDGEQATALVSEIDSIKEKLDVSELFKAFIAAQEKFSELIRAVNEEIGKCIGPVTDYDDMQDSTEEGQAN